MQLVGHLYRNQPFGMSSFGTWSSSSVPSSALALSDLEKMGVSRCTSRCLLFPVGDTHSSPIHFAIASSNPGAEEYNPPSLSPAFPVVDSESVAHRTHARSARPWERPRLTPAPLRPGVHDGWHPLSCPLSSSSLRLRPPPSMHPSPHPSHRSVTSNDARTNDGPPAAIWERPIRRVSSTWLGPHLPVSPRGGNVVIVTLRPGRC